MSSKPFKMAVVDDEAGVHKIFKAFFRKDIKNSSVELFHFVNGKECVDFLRDKRDEISIILVLSDINMPIMDGFTLLEILKKDFPEIEVDLITAYEGSEYSEKGLELGAHHVYTKPINFKILREDIFKRYKIAS